MNLCPHTFIEVERNDRYPFKLTQAVCNCISCLGLYDNYDSFQCTPWYIIKIALKRGVCLSNGEYEWTAALEKVPISCSCIDKTYAV